jgi:hypothetical protein
MNLYKKLHDSFIEEDPQAEKPVPATPAATPPVKPTFDFSGGAAYPMGPGTGATGAATAPSPFSVPGSVVLDEAVYQRVFQKTDFDQTDVGKAMHRYYDALPDVLDTNTKFKTALAQAAKLDGITSDKVLAAFDGLKTALQQESDRFSKVCDTQVKNEVTSRQQRLQQISDQIAQLTQQIADLQMQHTKGSGELGEAQSRVTNAQNQFTLAAARRSNEIDQQKAQFTALLQR